jgi:hypothetical protein
MLGCILLSPARRMWPNGTGHTIFIFGLFTFLLCQFDILVPHNYQLIEEYNFYFEKLAKI